MANVVRERLDIHPDLLVGAGRFELPTSRTRTVRATKLRYAPIELQAGAEDGPK